MIRMFRAFRVYCAIGTLQVFALSVQIAGNRLTTRTYMV
jgi:hypothetical protein